MYIDYVPSAGGITYAKVMESFRDRQSRVRKRAILYLGRVIDAEKRIFRNKTDGVFHLSEDLKTKIPTAADLVVDIKRKNSKDPERLLDFGDSFFLNAFLEQYGFLELAKSLPYGNSDSICALLHFYVLTKKANSHARLWMQGNYCSILYPKANLTSQRISDILEAVGTESSYQNFFRNYLDVVPQRGTERKAATIDESLSYSDGILIDSTGLPNSIRFPITAVSNHNGAISEEVRLIYVTQQSSGRPLYMRYVPGNVIDASTLVATMAELKALHIKTRFVILDAGYVTENNLKTLAQSKVSFLSRLPENRKLFKNTVSQNRTLLEQESNLCRYNQRLVYIKRIKTEIIPEVDGYLYLGLDIAERYAQIRRLGKIADEDNLSMTQINEQMKNQGIFCLVSSRKIAVDKVLPLYYTRQAIEQIFDIGKGFASFVPLHVQKETTFRGHLLFTFLAAAILKEIQCKANEMNLDIDSLFGCLHNQKMQSISLSELPPPEKTKNKIRFTINSTSRFLPQSPKACGLKNTAENTVGTQVKFLTIPPSNRTGLASIS